MKQKNNELPLVPKKSFWVRLREEKYLQVMALLGIVWIYYHSIIQQEIFYNSMGRSSWIPALPELF